MSTAPAIQLNLPYFEIKPTDLASREEVRKRLKTKNPMYGAPFDELNIRGGFNRRVKLKNIDELADSIEANGIQEPLVVDVIAGSNIIYIERGHRRFAALQLLRERYASRNAMSEFYDRFGDVPCRLNDKNVTELDRLAAQHTSNNAMPLTPYELATLAWDMKMLFGLNNTEIAQKLGIGRQSVNNYMIISEASNDIKSALMEETMTINAALALIQSGHGDMNSQEISEMLTGANNEKITAGTAKKKVSQRPKDPAAKAFNTSEANEAITRIRTLSDQVLIAVDGLNDNIFSQLKKDIFFWMESIQTNTEIIYKALEEKKKNNTEFFDDANESPF